MYSSSCPEPSGSPQGSFDRPALPTHRCAVIALQARIFPSIPPNLQTFVPERSNSEKPEIQNLIFRTFREIKK